MRNPITSSPMVVMLVMSVIFPQLSGGPPKGTLLLTGGGFGTGVNERFVSLAGGANANFVYIPTAASGIKLGSGFVYIPPDSDAPAANTREFEQELARMFGVTRITVLHTRNRNVADSEAFVEPLRRADGVWFSQGNAGRLANAYLDTLAQREVQAVLDRGGVVGGNSAGAIIQGSYIVRGRPDKPLLMAKGHERGFGFLKHVAINPHLTEARRDAELVNVVDAYPELLGIGLDEKAALVVQGDRFEVIGDGRVAIYDNKKHGGNWYYWLAPGTIFNLRTRTVQSAPASKNRDDVIARLERSIPQLMADGDVPGLSIALVRDGKLAWHKGFGVSNVSTKQPITDDTLFEAASLSKPVFAYAVLKLVDSGKLDLDTPLTKYLPGTYDVGDDSRLNQMTARHVLSHTTGFPNWRPRGATALKIHFTPGERFSYSGEGYVYLSKVVEHLTGENFDAFMKRLVFDPLGMTNSSFVWQDRYDALKVFSHSPFGEPTGQNKVTEANAAASLSTTARDYGRFITAILEGTGLKKETAALMLAPQVKVGSGTNSIDRPAGQPSAYISWGLGWGLQQTQDGTSFWHWGDNGNSKAYVVANETQKIGVVVFANSANGLSIIREIVDQSVGGLQPALDWLNYESHNSPGRVLLKSIRAKGARQALADYRVWRKGRAANELVNEAQMNRLGYMLLYGMKKVEDAIDVFKQNVEDYPQSSNVYDSLGEAYMVGGNKELAIKNYERSIELNPNNTTGKEMLKKLQEMK